MKSKTCPYCKKESFSAGAVPWICHHCEKDILVPPKIRWKWFFEVTRKLCIFIDLTDWTIFRTEFKNGEYAIQIGPIIMAYWKDEFPWKH